MRMGGLSLWLHLPRLDREMRSQRTREMTRSGSNSLGATTRNAGPVLTTRRPRKIKAAATSKGRQGLDGRDLAA